MLAQEPGLASLLMQFQSLTNGIIFRLEGTKASEIREKLLSQYLIAYSNIQM